MWLIPVLELLFTGGVMSLVVDTRGRRLGSRRVLASGGAASLAIAASLVLVASELRSYTAGPVTARPADSLASSLFQVDGLSTLAGFTVLTVGLAGVLYSLRLQRPVDSPGPYFALVCFLLSSLVGVVSAGDLLTLFLFWEGMSLSAYALSVFGRSALSLEAGLRYFLLAGLGAVLFVYGAAMVYSSTGSIELAAISTIASEGNPFGMLGVAVMVVGLGVEAAVVPVHTWLADVYSAAPAQVVSLISGAVTAAAVFALLKLVRPMAGAGGSPLQLILLALAAGTMLVGNLSAFSQSNFRRMLAFSSVAQTGYMLAALSTFTAAGFVAVGFTIWNQAILKSGLFMTVGSAGDGYEDAEFSALRGLGRVRRADGFLLAAASFAMMGAPPFGMFWGELLIVQALLLGPGPAFAWMALVVALNIVLSVGYYYRAVNVVVFEEPTAPRGVSRGPLLPPAALLALSLATGVVPFIFLGGI